MRSRLVIKAKEINNSIDIDLVLTKAMELQSGLGLIRNREGERVWFLQGPQLVNRGLFPKEIFFSITSFIISLSPISETETLVTAINDKLLFKNVENILNKQYLRFFSSEEAKNELNKAGDRHQKRKL